MFCQTCRARRHGHYRSRHSPHYNLYLSLFYIDIDGAVNVNVELSGEKLNLSILTVVASARNFREMRSDDRFEPIPVNCHCANQCPQLANAFRTRTEQECAL